MKNLTIDQPFSLRIRVTRGDTLVSFLQRAERAQFVLMADAVAQAENIDDSNTSLRIAEHILKVYIAAMDGSNAALFLNSISASR